LAADGICLVRTSETRESLPAAEVVRAYRNLSRMKWMCRALDGLETLVHPIRRRVEDRLRGHVFLCMLAYYVEWHMRQVLKPLLFEEEQIEPSRGSRHPVSRATSSKSGQSKKTTLSAPEGFPPHSFAALMEALAARCQCRCRLNSGGLEASFIQVAEPDALQRRAYELLNRIYRPSALS
jgi:hypothetical protein